MTRAIEAPETRNTVVLIEAEIDEQTLNGFGEIVRISSFDGLCEDVLHKHRPGTVICPLIFGRFDAIDVGNLLTSLHLPARLLVKPPHLPRPSMVLSELRATCPLLRIELLTDQLINTHTTLDG